MMTKAYRIIWIAMLIGLAACVGESAEDPAARTEPCGAVVDRTAPELAALLATAEITTAGATSTRYAADGTKISSQPLIATGESFVLDATLTCTSSCNGTSCAGLGCDPSNGNCSLHTCNGAGCTGTCTKTVTVPIKDKLEP